MVMLAGLGISRAAVVARWAKAAADVPVPVFPGDINDLTATAQSATEILLEWTPASDATSHEYRIGSGEWTAAGNGSQLVAGLTAETAYTFQVRGVNGEGPGNASNVAAATTEAEAPPVGEPQRIIWDTDLDSDIDDLTATAVLGAYVTMGEAVPIAATLATSNAASPHAMELLMKHMGYPDLPIGSYQGEDLDTGSGYTHHISGIEPPVKARSVYPEPVPVLRQALADAPDASVKIAIGGTATNIAALLQSPADGISPLTGAQLVAAKVVSIHMMGGSFTSTQGEANIQKDIPAAIYLAENTPVPIYWDGYEMGNTVYTRIKNAETYWEFDAFAKGWMNFSGEERNSWDLIAVQDAVRGNSDGHWTYSAPGDVTFDPVTSQTFYTANPAGKSRYLIRAVPGAEGDAQRAATLQALIDHYMAERGLTAQPSNPKRLALYTFEEGSGQEIVDSISGLNGFLGIDGTAESGEPTRTANGINVAGARGVTIPFNPALDHARVAVIAIVRPSVATGTMTIAARDNSAIAGRNWQLRSVNGNLAAVVRLGGGTVAPDTTAPLPVGEWALVTLWMNWRDLSLRKNGVTVWSEARTTWQNAVGQPLTIGATGNGATSFTTPWRGDIRYLEYATDKNAADIAVLEQHARDFAAANGITLP